MTGYGLVNLKDMIQELGEGRTKEILSEFSCPLNKDVEFFLHCKAIEFARQGIAQTQLVVTSYKDKPVLVGYFTLSNKVLEIPRKNILIQRDFTTESFAVCGFCTLENKIAILVAII